MKAILIESYGDPDVVQRRTDLPKPVAAPGHVLVKVCLLYTSDAADE